MQSTNLKLGGLLVLASGAAALLNSLGWAILIIGVSVTVALFIRYRKK